MDNINRPGMKKKIYAIYYTTPQHWFWYEDKPGLETFPTWGPFKTLALVEESINFIDSLVIPPSPTMSFTEALKAVLKGGIAFRPDNTGVYVVKIGALGYLVDGAGESLDGIIWNKSVDWLDDVDMSATDWRVVK